MRKLVLLTAAVALMSATALAAEVGSIALGWVKSEAPIGIRYQIAEKIAGDVGIGFQSFDSDITRINVHIGLPIELLAGDRASLAFRPGFTLRNTSYDEETYNDRDSSMDFYVHAWLAVYYAVTDNFGVTAAHGIDIAVMDGGEADNTTDFYTIGADAFDVGWFYWF